MESENKRRSGSYESEKGLHVSGEEKCSLSEGSNLDKEYSLTSPGSSEAGTLKKSKKFRPKKFIAKRFKSMKRGDETETKEVQSEQELKKSVGAKISEKLSSPKFQRFNLVKRFSGSKSYKVSPTNDDRSEVPQSNATKLESFNVSETEVGENQVEPISENLSVLKVEVPTELKKEIVENKKVQLQITISGKKVEKRGSPPSPIERAIDRASLAQLPRTDIILPSTSTQVRLSTSRDQFFRVEVVEGNNGHAKPIKNAADTDTFASVVKEGLSVKSAPVKSSSEVEKYLVLTSSLNTIITAAKELDDLNVAEKDSNIPQLDDLNIHDFVEPTETKKLLFRASSTPNKRDIDKPLFLDISGIAESCEMKRQVKKSKIPVDQRKRSGSSSDKDSLTTVHTQEASRSYHRNLSASSSTEEFRIQPPVIKFEVGGLISVPVRSQRTSPATSTIILAPLALADTQNLDSDESFHSPKSESLQTESSRRRIPYVPQLSIYTPEEQDLLRSNIEANALDSMDVSIDNSLFPMFNESAVRYLYPHFNVPLVH